MKLHRSFYNQSTLKIARDLLGMHLVRKLNGRRQVGRIVETEAYLGPKDLAAHSARGRTERNEVMFGPSGHAYVYLIYGVWHCLNVVTEAPGIPHAVLIRAIEPLQEIEDKTWGPGLLCRALKIDRNLNGEDLCGNKIWIERPSGKPARRICIGRAPRIGVDYAGPWAKRLWRFFDGESVYVSTISGAVRDRALKAA